MRITVGKMQVFIQREYAVLPNGDIVSIPSGCQDERLIADLIRAYLQGLYLASTRMTQPNLSAQDIFHMREEFHTLWMEANSYVG